jgi:hypothetical protein
MLLLFLVALLLQRISATDCVDDYFCDVLVGQIPCNTTNDNDSLAILSACPETCGECNETLEPSLSPTSAPTEHDELQDTVILLLLGAMMAFVVIGAIYINICPSEDDAETAQSNPESTKKKYQLNTWEAEQSRQADVEKPPM